MLKITIRMLMLRHWQFNWSGKRNCSLCIWLCGEAIVAAATVALCFSLILYIYCTSKLWISWPVSTGIYTTTAIAWFKWRVVASQAPAHRTYTQTIWIMSSWLITIWIIYIHFLILYELILIRSSCYSLYNDAPWAPASVYRQYQ